MLRVIQPSRSVCLQSGCSDFRKLSLQPGGSTVISQTVPVSVGEVQLTCREQRAEAQLKQTSISITSGRFQVVIG
jgi:hypothetical protein